MKKQPLFNKTGLLFMTDDEIRAHYSEAIREICLLKPQEFRQTQYENYKNFVLKVLGVDIDQTPHLDPFYELSGRTTKEAYLDKHNVSYKKECELMITTTTDIVSMDHLHSTSPARTGDYDPELDRFWGYKNEDETFVTHYGLIGEVLIGVEKEWKFNFASVDFSVYPKSNNPKLHIYQGLIFIQPEVAKAILNNPKSKQIYDHIVQIAELGNHDMLGHGTMDLLSRETPEGYLQANLTEKELEEYEIFYGSTFAPEHFKTYLVWFDEHRRLDYHFLLAKIFFERRNSLRIRMHRRFTKFVKLLEDAFFKEEITMDIMAYLIQLYLFFLLRLMPYDEVHNLCKECRVHPFLYGLLTNNEEINKMRTALSEKNGALYFDKKYYSDPKQWTSENAQFISHKTFYNTVFSRMQY